MLNKRIVTMLLVIFISAFILFSCSEDSTGPSNSNPAKPSNPFPADNATSIFTNTNLAWNCSDPDGDPLTYDLYFGTSSNPALANSGQSGTTYYPGTLNYETTYYWQIKVHDNHSDSTTGYVWQFTTSSEGSGFVELSSFTASTSTANGYTLLEWTTASESDVHGFNIYRADEDVFENSAQLNASIIPGQGTTTEPTDYEFEDIDQLNYNSTYYYWLESVDSGGETEVFGAIVYTPSGYPQNPNQEFDIN